MIIDCHGHYTTIPAAFGEYRDALHARLAEADGGPVPAVPAISDGEISETIEANQLRLQGERGIDMTIFSPRASWMDQHITDAATARAWARASNDLVHRVTTLFPQNFAGVCQLPQTPNGSLDDSVAELERCVTELGFVGCNLNPDPSGGFWSSPPMTDEYWFPVYEKMIELDVPAMIHVSTSRNPAVHTLGAHYLNADTTVFMQLVEGDLFGRFPDAAVRDPARRRRGALPLGPLPRPDRADEPAAARRARDEERVLRHLRLPPAGHRPADERDQRRQHPVRLRDARRRAR